MNLKKLKIELIYLNKFKIYNQQIFMNKFFKINL